VNHAVAVFRSIAWWQVRVFRRRVYVGDGTSASWSMGGIGEVCTLPQWRGRGLAGRLLDMSCAFMQASDIQFSALHAAEKARPLYVLMIVCASVCASVCVCVVRALLNETSLQKVHAGCTVVLRYARHGWTQTRLRYGVVNIALGQDTTIFSTAGVPSSKAKYSITPCDLSTHAAVEASRPWLRHMSTLYTALATSLPGTSVVVVRCGSLSTTLCGH